MFNNGNSAYGYDQLFVNAESYGDFGYDSSVIGRKPQQSAHVSQGPSETRGGARPAPYPVTQQRPDNYENIYDYLEKGGRDFYNKKSSKDDDIIDLKRMLAEFQQKQDYYILFIICIIIYVIINFGASGFGSGPKPIIHYVYHNPPSMSAPMGASLGPTMGPTLGASNITMMPA